MDVSDLLAITLKKNRKIKVAKWGTPKIPNVQQKRPIQSDHKNQLLALTVIILSGCIT